MTAIAVPTATGRAARRGSTPRWWADAAGSVALLSLLVVTAMWVHNRGLQELVAGAGPGTRVLIEGPYGKLTGQCYRGGGVTMLACGIGITPLLALLWELPYPGGQAVLVYRARSVEDLVLGPSWSSWAPAAAYGCTTCSAPGHRARRGCRPVRCGRAAAGVAAHRHA